MGMSYARFVHSYTVCTTQNRFEAITEPNLPIPEQLLPTAWPNLAYLNRINSTSDDTQSRHTAAAANSSPTVFPVRLGGKITSKIRRRRPRPRRARPVWKEKTSGKPTLSAVYVPGQRMHRQEDDGGYCSGGGDSIDFSRDPQSRRGVPLKHIICTRLAVVTSATS